MMGQSISEVSWTFEIPRSTKSRVCREFQNEGIRIHRDQRNGRPKVLDYRNRRRLLRIVLLAEQDNLLKSQLHLIQEGTDVHLADLAEKTRPKKFVDGGVYTRESTDNFFFFPHSYVQC